MPFLQIHISLGAQDPQAVEDACLATGALSVTLADAGDNPILEPAPGATPLWPSVALSALYEANVDQTDLINALRHELNAPDLFVATELLADRIWEREWLKDFKPMRFGKRLWICPGGQTPPTNDVIGTHPIIVQLDPGLAFGTGTHPTTALCLEWLDSADLKKSRVLDIGCGSGVLAIAALLLGARHAQAVDIDPQALLATAENAARNHVNASLSIQPAEAPWPTDCDVILANILAEPLIALAPRFAAVVTTGATLVLSGLLAGQETKVMAACAPWFAMEAPRELNGWMCLVGHRH